MGGGHSELCDWEVLERVRDTAPMMFQHVEFCLDDEECEHVPKAHRVRECNLLDEGCYAFLVGMANQLGVW